MVGIARTRAGNVAPVRSSHIPADLFGKSRPREKDCLVTAPGPAFAAAPRYRHQNAKTDSPSLHERLESGLQAVRNSIAISPDGLKSGLQTLPFELPASCEAASGAWPSTDLQSQRQTRELSLAQGTFSPSRRSCIHSLVRRAGRARIRASWRRSWRAARRREIPWTSHDGSADGDALVLTAGERFGSRLEVMLEAEHCGRLAHAGVDLPLDRRRTRSGFLWVGFAQLDEGNFGHGEGVRGVRRRTRQTRGRRGFRPGRVDDAICTHAIERFEAPEISGRGSFCGRRGATGQSAV